MCEVITLTTLYYLSGPKNLHANKHRRVSLFSEGMALSIELRISYMQSTYFTPELHGHALIKKFCCRAGNKAHWVICMHEF